LRSLTVALAAAAAAVVPLPLLVCSAGSDPVADPRPGVAAPTAAASGAIEFVEFSHASMYTQKGVYTLEQARPGDLMLLYLTDMEDFTMLEGWTPIGEVIVLHLWGLYPCKGFYRVRQEGDPTTYAIAQTTGFLSVYRGVDPDHPIGSFTHAVSESQTPPIGDLRAPADGAASVYFFIGLYHSNVLSPDGYEEIYGCRHYDGTANDAGMGHRLGVGANDLAGGHIYIAGPGCQSPGVPPYKEAILHVMLAPAG
jgi:hypothetical protein